MKRTSLHHVHSVRLARALERAAFADECATLAPAIKSIAEKYGYAPITVARTALARIDA